MGSVRRMLRAMGLGRAEPVILPVQFYTRQGCHLCDDALKLLGESIAHFAHFSLGLEVIDIDQDAELIARYGDKVPVLVINGRERLWGKINAVLLHRSLEAEAKNLLRAAQADRAGQQPESESSRG